MSNESVGVLVSGGLDSAVLLADAELGRGAVVPIYVRSGLHWEPAELEHLARFLRALNPSIEAALVVLDLPVADLYAAHWSLTGVDVPGADSSDQAVYLPGRNVLLLSKSLVWCHLHSVPRLALGVLAGNPFPDAAPEFFQSFAETVNRATGGSVRIETPYAGMTKIEVLRRGRDLPLEHTFSCIDPVDGQHCGRCNKCAERRSAFAEAGMADPTPYTSPGAATPGL